VFYSYFNLTNKSNLIWQALIPFNAIFYHLVMSYFFGAPLYGHIRIGVDVSSLTIG